MKPNKRYFVVLRKDWNYIEDTCLDTSWSCRSKVLLWSGVGRVFSSRAAAQAAIDRTKERDKRARPEFRREFYIHPISLRGGVR